MASKSPQKTFWLINQYASTPDTGMGGRHYCLSKELAKQGYRVYLIAAGFTHILRKPPHLKKGITVQSITKNFDFVWINLPKYRNAHDKKRVLNWLRLTWQLFKLPSVIMDRPNIIVASSPSQFIFIAAQRLAKKFNAKLVFEVRDIWPLTFVEVGGYSTNNLFIKLMQWLEDKAYRESDYVLSNLPNLVEHMRNRGMNSDNFAWIPNGFDKSDLEKIQKLNKMTASAIPKNKFIVGYTGTLGLANTLDTFIDSAKILVEQRDISFVLVGDGLQKKNLMKKANKLHNITFIDPIPKHEIQSVLANFDVCYIGLTKDPLFRYGVSPNKLFDYFLSAKPIIYAIESGEYLPVSDARAGLSIKPESPKLLADAILKVKSLTPKERREMGENGRAYVLDNHDYAKLSKKFARILLTLRK